ncbi:MAG: energy-coupling factor transporter transmembrane protein EcfT [Clostridiaceae bacterium]|jgi:energy-coupling factor transport system permease protein|nr:energy-coupling factor transporter transmembrane protein EcfT [Clostridiaceae bacterium]
MEDKFIINFTLGDTPLHQLTGTSKVRLFLSLIAFLIAVWDIRVIMPLLFVFAAAIVSTRPYWKPIRFVFTVVILMNLFNLFLFFLFNPTVGEIWTGTFTQFGSLSGRYVLGYETMWYFGVRFAKMITTFLLCMAFILSITPSEFAAGLNSLRLPYRFCIIVELAFRYIPDLLRDYRDISVSAQARGSETDKRKTSVFKRLKSSLLIIVPLIITSFSKVGDIANAMDLRGFGRKKKRSWYAERPPQKADRIAQLVALLFLIATLYFTLMRIFNPANPEMWYPYNDLVTYNWRIIP